MIWKPNVTVAAVIEHEHHFLMVQERIAGQLQLNQPAGHLDPNESLIEALIRETQEETRYTIKPTHLIGIYHVNQSTPWGLVCYLRFAFAGQCVYEDTNRTLDPSIVNASWLSYDQIKANQATHRSALVQQCIDDYCAGKRYPLELLHADASLSNPSLSIT